MDDDDLRDTRPHWSEHIVDIKADVQRIEQSTKTIAVAAIIATIVLIAKACG